MAKFLDEGKKERKKEAKHFFSEKQILPQSELKVQWLFPNNFQGEQHYLRINTLVKVKIAPLLVH